MIEQPFKPALPSLAKIQCPCLYTFHPHQKNSTMFCRLALAFAALLSVVSAQLTITSPGTNDWWVASSLNTILWTCSTSPFSNFTILLANSNTAVLATPLAIIAVEENYNCATTITQQQSAQPAATGYTIQFANTLNTADIYIQSEPFEIKALGAPYPTATGSAGSTSTGIASGSAGTIQATTTSSTGSTSAGTASGSVGAAQTTTTGSVGSTSTGTASGSAGAPTQTGGALAEYVPVGMSMVAALALGLVVA
ncbi:hypothetical protein EDB19DRAFT_1732364 [Suillus lakei]|nr:hypothetical protein EDB19DRAFT_1732364 [Suillus lakei]